MRIDQALVQARALGVARLDAQLLLSHLLGRPREWLLAHDDEMVGAAQAAELQALLARRAAGEPLAYLVGGREFRGLWLEATADVLVPRPETEVLVDWALELLTASPAADVVDLGTGSGAIAVAIGHACARVGVCASDSSAAALAVARRNAAAQRVEITFALGDWWAPWAARRFGLAVSNPPYVAQGDPHLAALAHEPQAALTAGANGLTALRRIVRGAPQHLRPGAWLLLEHGHDQAAAVHGMFVRRGFTSPRTRNDLAGLPRCTGAAWPGEK